MVQVDHTPMDDHTPKSTWASQIGISGFKKKKTQSWVGREGEMDQGRAGTCENYQYSLAKTYF